MPEWKWIAVLLMVAILLGFTGLLKLASGNTRGALLAILSIALFVCIWLDFFIIHGMDIGIIWNRFGYVYEAKNPHSFWFAIVWDFVITTLGEIFIFVVLVMAWKKGLFSKSKND